MAEYAESEITITQGQRKSAIDPNSKTYRPHFKVRPDSEMLGVQFESGPPLIMPGDTVIVIVSLIYHPKVSYDSLKPNVKFSIVEGNKSIGEGKIIRRWSK